MLECRKKSITCYSHRRIWGECMESFGANNSISHMVSKVYVLSLRKLPKEIDIATKLCISLLHEFHAKEICDVMVSRHQMMLGRHHLVKAANVFASMLELIASLLYSLCGSWKAFKLDMRYFSTALPEW